MGSIKVQISDEVERKFREAAMHQFGFQKGSLSLAAESAFLSWIREREDVGRVRKLVKKEGIRDIVSEIKGILKHVKKTSVELQHEARKLRGKKAEEGVDRR
jgi:hypothetical protein